ncbi:MAG: hypothetical protein OXG55_15070 [bacterium]|nr:hypothetical protein [bacterium]MCY3952422.1 hypothetical protein [bacterium]MCY4104558.1 hypothetical protein [bacterium]
MNPVLHDTVTLRHFAAAANLSVLEVRHGDRPEPRWTEAIKNELESAASAGEDHCSHILDEFWLGRPAIPSGSREFKTIYRLQVGLNDGRWPAVDHRGEAEGIYFAEKHGGDFATDDNGAYDFARRRPSLGPGRVFDSIHILRSAVAMGEITAVDAAGIADGMEAAGRSFRPEHRVLRSPAYFA